MNRLVTTVMLGMAILCFPAVSVSADDPIVLAADPRVADAVHAWEEWIEYQTAINRVPGVSIAVVHDQELISTDAFGLADPASLLIGAETRTSSPVRIERDPDGCCPGAAGLFPAGEGAGHAGGIVSSAVDGIRQADALIARLLA